jgi:hypothetical protein
MLQHSPCLLKADVGMDGQLKARLSLAHSFQMTLTFALILVTHQPSQNLKKCLAQQ